VARAPVLAGRAELRALNFEMPASLVNTRSPVCSKTVWSSRTRRWANQIRGPRRCRSSCGDCWPACWCGVSGP